jgi:hypothetical protein
MPVLLRKKILIYFVKTTSITYGVSRCKLKDYRIDPSCCPVEKGLSIISASLSKKSGIKTEEKVYERIGRLKQKYPSVARYYEISYEIEIENITSRKTKETTEVRKVKSLTWKLKQDIEPNGESGTYFLRTSLSMSEELTWMIYNIIREIEYSFRTLKTDLDLRPIYHKKDSSTMAHLHLRRNRF